MSTIFEDVASFFIHKNQFEEAVKDFNERKLFQSSSPTVSPSCSPKWVDFVTSSDCTIRRVNGEILTVMYVRGCCSRCISGIQFNTEEEMGLYIQDHVKECILQKVVAKDAENYFLNVCSIDDESIGGIPDLAWTKGYHGKLLEKQLQVYMPIIRYFMLYGFKELFGEK